MTPLAEIFRLKPRHRWFSSSSPDGDGDGMWDGPYKTIEDAALAQFCEGSDVAWICQGRKCTREERPDYGFEWIVSARLAFTVQIKKDDPIFGRWRCSCGEFMVANSPAWRWNGFAWEHHHGYPIGHVVATLQ
jgi:hypothetical protein